MNEQKTTVDHFVAVCNLLGDVLDMIQAGGGNASAKIDDIMYIKASGYLMSEVTSVNGYTRVKRSDIVHLIEQIYTGEGDGYDDTFINTKIAAANLETLRPSIETFLHALLPQKFVLHVHALTSLVYASSKTFTLDLERQFTSAYPLKQMLLIPYKKPGIALALTLYEGLQRYIKLNNTLPQAIILQNHGLIVASNTHETLYDQIVEIQSNIQNYLGLDSNIDAKYRLQFTLKRLLMGANDGKSMCVRVSEDVDLQSIEISDMCFPDALVYCGYEPLSLASHDHDTEHHKSIIKYIDRYGEMPKVVLYKKHLFFVGESIKKCLEVQDVLKIQVLLQKHLGDERVSLTKEEAHEILNWEAEVYRKHL